MLGVPFMLSGGLDARRTSLRRCACRAPGVDVSSGVERAPGVKDPDKIRAFIRAARAAADEAQPARSGELRMTVQRPAPSAPAPTSAAISAIFGGRFVAETLMPLILELEQAYAAAKADPAFQAEMDPLPRALRRPAVAFVFRRSA